MLICRDPPWYRRQETVNAGPSVRRLRSRDPLFYKNGVVLPSRHGLTPSATGAASDRKGREEAESPAADPHRSDRAGRAA